MSNGEHEKRREVQHAPIPFPVPLLQKEEEADEVDFYDKESEQKQTYDVGVKLDSKDFLCINPIQSMVKNNRPLEDKDSESDLECVSESTSDYSSHSDSSSDSDSLAVLPITAS